MDDHVQALAWASDSALLAAAAINGSIALFDGDGERRLVLSGHAFGTTSIDWSADGRLASGGQDGHVCVWNAAAGAPALRLPAGAAWVEQVAWSPDGTLLAAAAGKRVRVWDRDGRLVREFGDHPSTVSDIAWKPGSHTVTAAAYGGVFLWDADAETNAGRHLDWQGSTLVLAWSPDGRYIATGDQDATVHFWIAKTETDLQMWGYATKVRELSWDAASRYLATGGSETIVIWDCSGRGPEGTKPKMLDGHEDYLSAVAWQKRGNVLASADAAGGVMLWRPDRARIPLAVAIYDSGVSCLAWSPNDRSLAVGCGNGLIEVLASPVSGR